MAALFGFGTDIFSFRSVYEGTGTDILMRVARLGVYVILALLLVFKGGWAAIDDPGGYAKEFGDVKRPPYFEWTAVYDVLGVGISTALAQGLRMMAHINPAGPQDE